MIYQRIYLSIITHAKIEELLGIRQRGNGIYYEGHHVFPKSLFPELVKVKENIVLLTAREHFICHRLLTRIYPVSQMFYALWRMCCGERNGNLHISSREYARIREECRRNINWEEHGRKVSESWSKKSPEEKQSIILSLKKTNEERKRKISQTLKNKTSEQKMQKRLKEAATRAAWSEERKLECSRKRSERQSKYLWWNNGVVNKMSELQPGPDFIPGRLPFKKNK